MLFPLPPGPFDPFCRAAARASFFFFLLSVFLLFDPKLSWDERRRSGFPGGSLISLCQVLSIFFFVRMVFVDIADVNLLTATTHPSHFFLILACFPL